MGIKNLNRYLKDNCKESIKCINISDLKGQKIAVDISIYLYKYEADNALLENMYLMLSIFRQYQIIPIFIFDGKSPPEKKQLLQKRKDDKEDAKKEYERLSDRIKSNDDINEDELKDINSTMDLLKKQFIYMGRGKTEKVKELIRAYGSTYYDAPGEADELCAMLVIKKKVWACLSEDMDLFVYGCSRVLRYFSLLNHNVVLYYTKGILEELKMDQNEFREICVLSGTDYNINANGDNKSISIYQAIKYFHKYKNNKNNNQTFYEGINNSNYVLDYELLIKINEMFNILNKYNLDLFKKIKIINGPINMSSVKEIMKEDDFIFLG
jgi:5'-3' exonuclease